MKKVVIFIVAILTVNLYAEQSVYSDSDFIDSDAVAKKNSREIFILKQKISQLKEKIEGLKSIIEGQSATIEQLKAKNNSNLENIVNQLAQRVATLESKPAQVVKAQTPTQEVQKSQESVKTESTKEKTEQKPNVKKKLSSKELFKESVLNFTKGKLTKAQQGFKELIKRKYKSASSNFYLGEIAFKKGRYKEAITYYQTSVTINDSASYMDKLLLHTAISLKKKGRAGEAKTFFNAVVTSYPDSSSAKEAKKYLK